MSNERPAQLHLVVGSTGAGKTTYAQALSKQAGALHLSIDDWMATLFGPDRPDEADFQWMIARVCRCEDQMWSLILQAAKLKVSIVADCGFTRRGQRDRWRDRAAKAGLLTSLHHLDVTPEERWRRVSARNGEKGPTFSFEVTRAMFDFIEQMWEPPAGDELKILALPTLPPEGNRSFRQASPSA